MIIENQFIAQIAGQGGETGIAESGHRMEGYKEQLFTDRHPHRTMNVEIEEQRPYRLDAQGKSQDI